MKKPLLFARDLVATSLKPSGFAIDATCGNGHDTLFLAETVGPHGSVLAIDVQAVAITNTRNKLAEAGLLHRVELTQTGHENLVHYLDRDVDAVMFNLGFLPGGDHEIKTSADTTVSALQTVMTRLAPKGIITLVIYTGHDGGSMEYDAVRNYLSTLPQRDFTVLEYQFINQINNPPLLLAVTRL